MGGLERGEELWRVRHMYAALYVARTLRLAGTDPELVAVVSLSLDRRENAAQFDRARAERVADAWIALTGDSRIEIEPVE